MWEIVPGQAGKSVESVCFISLSVVRAHTYRVVQFSRKGRHFLLPPELGATVCAPVHKAINLATFNRIAGAGAVYGGDKMVT